MNKMQKTIIGIAAVCVLFFAFVVIRVGIAKPNDASVKLQKISMENNAQFGKEAYKDAYPLEYNSFMKNMEGAPAPGGYSSSEEGYSHIEHQPEILENFKGYKFSIQYDDDRGHTYAGQDILNSKRRPGQKGICIVCKGSYMYDVFYKETGWQFASKPFDEIAAQIPDDGWFGCSTCHDPETMELRVYNQGFRESMARRGIDVDNVSPNEKRAYVCGQCHTEYYFAAEDGRVQMPYENGFDPEEEYRYYQSGQAGGFQQDWIQPDSKARMLKTQHPDFEMWSKSVHADAGVTCVDCHMPYMRDNGKKYTSHWMTSPLRTVEDSCLKCHDESKETLIARVKTIHENTWRLQRIAGQTVARAHMTVKAAADAGATDEQLANVRLQLREAQWYWDWVAAENGMGFHNPDLACRTLGRSIDLAHTVIEQANAIVKGSLL